MKKRHHYIVAGESFSVSYPEELRPSANLLPFQREEAPTMFNVDIQISPEIKFDTNETPSTKLLEEETNIDGNMRLMATPHHYHLYMTTSHDNTCRLTTDKNFHKGTITLPTSNDPELHIIISGMLRFIYSNAIISRGGIAVHASSVILDEKGYIFLGESGTGKSTHSRLWIKNFGAELLNDDNPVIKHEANGQITINGTPWSGKTPCYKAMTLPLEAAVRLRQSPHNHYKNLTPFEAFITLMPSCSLVPDSPRLDKKTGDTLEKIVNKIKTGILSCRPDQEAATICRQNIDNKKRQQ